MSELLGDLVNQWHRVISKPTSPTATPRIGQLTQPDPHMLHFISDELYCYWSIRLIMTHLLFHRNRWNPMELFVLLIVLFLEKWLSHSVTSHKVTVTTRVVYK